MGHFHGAVDGIRVKNSAIGQKVRFETLYVFVCS